MSQHLLSYCHNPENTQACPNAWRAACPIFSRELQSSLLSRCLSFFSLFQVASCAVFLLKILCLSGRKLLSQSLWLPVAGMKPLNKCIHWTDATEVPRKGRSRGICCLLGFPDQQSAILELRWWCAVLHTLRETTGMSPPDTYLHSGWPRGHVCPVYKDPVPRILTINSRFHFSSFVKT